MANFEYKAWLNARWESLPAKYKKTLGWVGAIIVVLGVMYIAVSRTPPRKPPPEPKKTLSLFGEKGRMGQFGVSRVASQLEQMERENKDLREKVERLSEKKAAAPGIDASKLQSEVAKQLQQELAKMREGHEADKKQPEAHKEKTAQKGETGKRTESGAAPRKGQSPASSANKSGRPAGVPGAPGVPAVSAAKEIKVIAASSESKDRMQIKDERKKDKDVGTFLPAGSIFSGTLITGLDVSCGKSSKKDPFPVLLRVKKEAILPNRYTADVRECFLIAAGWGDLGSERAYLRAERLSCIREDGKAIETKVDMYAVGEDGKAGVRGRLVSKTGALMSKALMAGFMSGFSQVFTKQPVAVIATGQPGQTSPFQSTLSKDSLQTAGLEGAGSALERLAKYYMDMAKDIFPVIEIDAGRAVDFVLISGKSLKLQSRKSDS